MADMIIRRIYIVVVGTEITPEVIQAAADLRCKEIIVGIPPFLEGKVTPEQLPMAYQEKREKAGAVPIINDPTQWEVAWMDAVSNAQKIHVLAAKLGFEAL